MKRKVVQQGPATLMISLPSKWIKENAVCKGDELDIIEEKGKLVLTVETTESSTLKKEFSVKDFGIFNEYFVNYFYQKGYDEIIIRFDDVKYTDIIEKRVKQLMGFEIVENKKNVIIIKSLMKIDQQEFDTVLKKLFQITLVIGDKITEALEKNITQLLEEVKIDEKENNKYCDLCIRILYKHKYKYPDHGFTYFALLRELEQIGDLYKYIAFAFQNKVTPDNDVDKDILELYKKIHAHFRLYYELFYSYTPEKARIFFDQKNILLEECEKKIIASSQETILLQVYFTSLVHAIFDLKGPLFLMKI